MGEKTSGFYLARILSNSLEKQILLNHITSHTSLTEPFKLEIIKGYKEHNLSKIDCYHWLLQTK